MSLAYRCLVIDHDDTVVDSTATVHFPCFCEYLKLTRPAIEHKYTLSEYILKNFEGGILPLLRDELGMDDAELRRESEYWAEYVKHRIPHAYPGIREVLTELRTRGGIIAVSSHSMEKYILRDYEENGLPIPDAVYSCDLPRELVKPSPHAVFDIMERYSLSPSDILVLDDMRPGYDMARAAGVRFAAAGWAYDIPETERFMRGSCDVYLRSPDELAELLFKDR